MINTIVQLGFLMCLFIGKTAILFYAFGEEGYILTGMSICALIGHLYIHFLLFLQNREESRYLKLISIIALSIGTYCMEWKLLLTFIEMAYVFLLVHLLVV